MLSGCFGYDAVAFRSCERIARLRFVGVTPRDGPRFNLQRVDERPGLERLGRPGLHRFRRASDWNAEFLLHAEHDAALAVLSSLVSDTGMSTTSANTLACGRLFCMIVSSTSSTRRPRHASPRRV